MPSAITVVLVRKLCGLFDEENEGLEEEVSLARAWVAGEVGDGICARVAELCFDAV